MTWFFDEVLRGMPGREWRTANCLYYSRDLDAAPHRVASVRDLDTQRIACDTHYVIPFDLLRTFLTNVPALSAVGDAVVEPVTLPQGLHGSSGGTILNGCWQRRRKFSSALIPHDVRALMRECSTIYVDDALHTIPYLLGDPASTQRAEDALSELLGAGPYTQSPLYDAPLTVTREPGPKFLEATVQTHWGFYLHAAHRNPSAGELLHDSTISDIPFHSCETAHAQHAYVIGMFARAEQNCSLRTDIVRAIMEMAIELQLKCWTRTVIERGMRARAASRTATVAAIAAHHTCLRLLGEAAQLARDWAAPSSVPMSLETRLRPHIFAAVAPSATTTQWT